MFAWLKHYYRTARRRYHIWRVAAELRRVQRMENEVAAYKRKIAEQEAAVDEFSRKNT